MIVTDDPIKDGEPPILSGMWSELIHRRFTLMKAQEPYSTGVIVKVPKTSDEDRKEEDREVQ